MVILDILKEHNTEETAIKSGELSFITGYKGVEIRAEINRLRRNGEPICSCSKGYYYSNSITDVYKTIANLSSRVSSINEAIEGLSNSLIKLNEQGEI